ncbi:YfiR family protein [Nisaea sp.]|uniref:YfiR family protein n=1 Tax=Nisaea sp. TaxID=2024842 RepID=UPI0032EEC5F4
MAAAPSPARCRHGAARKLLRRGLTLLALALALAMPPLHGLADPSRDDAIKAGFLFNFAEFADWPNKRPRPTDIAFCIEAGTIPREAFGKFSSVQIGERQISTTIAAATDFLDIRTVCDLIFLRSTEPDLPRLLSLAEQRHVLLVSDRAGFAASGGHIELYLSQGKYRFRVNLATMRRSGIELSSKVLRLAEIVSPDGGT